MGEHEQTGLRSPYAGITEVPNLQSVTVFFDKSSITELPSGLRDNFAEVEFRRDIPLPTDFSQLPDLLKPDVSAGVFGRGIYDVNGRQNPESISAGVSVSVTFPKIEVQRLDGSGSSTDGGQKIEFEIEIFDESIAFSAFEDEKREVTISQLAAAVESALIDAGISPLVAGIVAAEVTKKAIDAAEAATNGVYNIDQLPGIGELPSRFERLPRETSDDDDPSGNDSTSPLAPETSIRPVVRPDELGSNSDDGNQTFIEKASDNLEKLGEDIKKAGETIVDGLKKLGEGLKDALTGSKPIIFDLTGNGVQITELSNSSVYMDATGDGLKNKTAWAGAGDAVLFYDPNDTGEITEARQYIFTEWDPTAKPDFEALAVVFGTNRSGAACQRAALLSA